MTETYTGILDQESRLVDQISANVFTPVVLPFLFFMLPIIASVATGLVLNLLYPQIQPGPLGWFNLAVWYPLEIWYAIRQWKKALKEKWLSLRYWVGKQHFDIECQVIKWELMGKVDPKTKIAGTKLGPIKQPDTEAAGDQIYRFFLRGIFPIIYVALKDVPDRLLNYTGNVGNVIVGGLLFEVKNIAAVSFTRCDFTRDDENEFIPIGVFTDCAQMAEDIAQDRKVTLPQVDAITQAPQIVGAHDGSLYKRKWLDSEAIRNNIEKERDNIDTQVKKEVSYAVDKFREGDTPIPGIPKEGAKLPGSRNQWIGTIIFIGIVVVLAVIFSGRL